MRRAESVRLTTAPTGWGGGMYAHPQSDYRKINRSYAVRSERGSAFTTNDEVLHFSRLVGAVFNCASIDT